MDRRNFIGKTIAASAGVSLGSASAMAGGSKAIKIIGVSCSPREGKTTATAVRAALDAAGEIDGRIKTELLDLGGLQIGGWPGPTAPEKDDFEEILVRLKDPDLGGLIIGSPVYFRTMSSLCKAFIERCAVLRSPKMVLADKPVGAVAVGAFRNGGQELVIEQIQAALLCHQAAIVGGRPPAFQGATLLNSTNDDITKDEIGMDTARKLGVHVAEAALKMTG